MNSQPNSTTSVAIIGGGITGLTAAYRLQQRRFPVTLYEGSHRTGGVIESTWRDGYLAESGPNTILETSPKIAELVDELRLEGRRIYSSASANQRYLVRGGRLAPVPESPVEFLRTSLFSVGAKLRLLAEPFVPRAPEGREESVAEFVERRLGHEFLDYAIDALVGGIYAGDPKRLSLEHAFPKLRALEQRYGSLIVGQVRGAKERRRRADVAKPKAKKFSFDDGLQVLPDVLRAVLDDAVELNSPVVKLEEDPAGWIVTSRVGDRPRRRAHAAVLFAGPAHKLRQIQVCSERPINVAALADIYYSPVATMALGFRRQDVAHPLDGFGLLIPRIEQFHILGTIFSSSLFPHRAPPDHVLLTSFIGGARAPELAGREPDELLALTMHDLKMLLGVRGEPTFVHSVRYLKAIPQYEVGYGRFQQLMDDIERKTNGFFLAGHFRNGISLSDSIVAGETAAERIAGYFAKRNPGLEPGGTQFVASLNSGSRQSAALQTP